MQESAVDANHKRLRLYNAMIRVRAMWYGAYAKH
jgi:hypothetical protein